MFNRLIPGAVERRLVPAALALLGVTLISGCSDAVGPEPATEPEPTEPFVATPVQTLYSLSPANMALSSAVGSLTDASMGNRWCGPVTTWLDPTSTRCYQTVESAPFGTAVLEDTDIVLTAGWEIAAPFLWTGPPTRVNPFPEEGDFFLEFRMTVEQLGTLYMGLTALQWDPAQTDGTSDPMAEKVLQVLARSQDGLRVHLLDQAVSVPDVWTPHQYRLVYEDGAYTLYVDGEVAAGPIQSTHRPTALWMGHPSVVRGGEWSDVRISQLTTGSPAAEVLAVPLAVKPGDCPAPFNRRSRGVLPVSIQGTAELDVSQIDVSTLRLQGTAPARDKASLEDVASPVEPFTGRTAADCSVGGADGHQDLAVKFSSEAIAETMAGVASGDEVVLTLTGNLLPDFGGTAITGEAVVVIVGR